MSCVFACEDSRV